MSHIFAELERLCKDAGITLEKPEIVHKNASFTIRGERTVRYYAFAKSRDAYVSGETGRVKNSTPAQAFALAMKK